VIGDPETKGRIRVAAEVEERRNYEGGRLTLNESVVIASVSSLPACTGWA
jgi:hypothetical protein